MMTNSDVSTLNVLESEYCAAVESRSAARDAANSADFRFRATLEIYEHANNLKQALEKNRFFEDEMVFTTLFQRFVKMQREAQDVYRNAGAAYELANKTVQKSFYELQKARKSASINTPEENVPDAPDELVLKAI